tara:strand:+ start:413 stop:595 length:183 start_codon:yes stop_codon:yes gene_type:complete
MEILTDLNNNQLHHTIIKEVAKARNEMKCAESDLKKANSRLGFLIVIANELLTRTDKKES